MKRLIFMNDILFHSTSNLPTWHSWIADILNPAIDLACNQKIILFPDLTNKDGEVFNRKKFYELSNIHNITQSYYPYEISNIQKSSWEYLFSFITKEDLIIGCEIGLDLRRALTKERISFINFWFHSFKLFDDICFMLNTNNRTIFKKIKKYQIPKQKFNLYTTITKRKLLSDVEKLPIEDNCCLFIGQTMTDKSIEKNGKFLNISDFAKEIDDCHHKYSKIYYVPHPYAPIKSCPEVYEFIKKRPFIQVLQNVPTYTLLSSDKVKKVIALSSSVLYEAQFFGKDIEYLYQPLFNIDAEYDENTWISVYNDYLNPKFWIEILDEYFQVNQENALITLFDHRQSVIRGDVANAYHGYRLLDNYMLISDKIKQLENKPSIYKTTKTHNKIAHYLCGIPFYKQIQKDNKMTYYLLGLPIYRRCGEKISILGIPIPN